MDAVRQYALRVICSGLICGILMDLSSKTGYAKLLRLCCSIFFAITMVQPLIALTLPQWEGEWNLLFHEAGDVTGQGEEIYQRSIAAIIQQEAQAYILKEAESIGAALEVEIELSGETPPSPVAATLRGEFDASMETEISALLADEFGIPKEHQTWIRQQSHSSDSSLLNTNLLY